LLESAKGMEKILVAGEKVVKFWEWNHEANFPASQPKKSENPWIPGSKEDSRGQGRLEAQAREGEEEARSNDLQKRAKVDVVEADRRLRARERITRARDFERIRSHGRRYRVGPFIMIVAENELGYRRIGVSVSRKAGKAVVRNRIRRVIKEYFRLNKEKFPPSSDILFICREPVGDFGLGRFAELIEPVLVRLS